MAVEIPQHILELEPYRAGKGSEELKRERQVNRVVKLASNENPLGPSPKALQAISKHLGSLHRYCDPKAHDLVHALSKKYGKRPEQMICAHGSDSLLAYAINAFTAETDEILTSEGTFIGLYVNSKKFARRLVLVAMRDYHFDLPGILRAISPQTKIIYLANPNNPTGTIFTRQEFEFFLSKVPKEILVILDEAYTAYAEDQAQYPNGMQYDYPNLLVMRTFSKAYGLAGLRVGFAFGPERLIQEMFKVKLPFEPNLLAQVAALAALEDEDFLRKTKQQNAHSLTRMQEKFTALGLRHLNTAANFIMLVFLSDQFALDFSEQCLREGLILRHLKSFGIPQGVRINSGNQEETDFALEVIEHVYSRIAKEQK